MQVLDFWKVWNWQFVALYNVHWKSIDFYNDTIKITGIHFSYYKKKWNEKKLLESITKIQNVLKVWRKFRLTLEGKIIVFKTLAISNICFLSLKSRVPTELISELEWIQKTFLWPSKTKIKNECSDFKYGGLKNVNIQSSMILGEKIFFFFYINSITFYIQNMYKVITTKNEIEYFRSKRIL